MASSNTPPPIEGNAPVEIEAPTVKAAVAQATEIIESGEATTVVAEVPIPEGKEDDPKWLRNQMEALLTEVRKLSNDNQELRAILTRQEDQLKLVISSKRELTETPPNSEVSQISEKPQELPIQVPPEVPPNAVADDHQEVQTRPRRRRKI